jgi:hypothetical protein
MPLQLASKLVKIGHMARGMTLVRGAMGTEQFCPFALSQAEVKTVVQAEVQTTASFAKTDHQSAMNAWNAAFRR